MPAATASYEDWKAPAEDGGVLVWPATLADDTRLNAETLAACDVLVQGRPLAELRREARGFLGIGDEPVVVTGHQAELYHPGVWAKNLVLHHAAEALGGRALHVVVDTDSPKHLNLRWPAERPGQLGGDEPITDDPALASADWTGRLRTPSPAHVEHLRGRLAAAAFDHVPMIAGVLDHLAAANVEQTLTLAPDGDGLPAALAAATHALDWELGLRYDALTLSPVLFSPAFLTFVHHVAADLPRFAADYNAALADYRREAGLSDPARPMPDLAAGELPLWLDDLATGRRERARLAGGSLHLGGEAFAFDPAADADEAARGLAMFLRRHRHRLAPRALTLTLFLRLFVADQFVHGIGGGRYDQVTDRLIRSHFGLAPPRFAVATATLHFPGAGRIERVCPPCLKSRAHDLAHDFAGKPGHLAAVNDATGRARLDAYRALHAARRSAERPPLRAVLDDLDDVRRRVKWEASWFDRELFYALQPRERLTSLIERFSVAF